MTGEVMHIGVARKRRRGTDRRPVLTIKWDATAEWDFEGRHGVGLWIVYLEGSSVPYARQPDLWDALRIAGEVVRDQAWCEACAEIRRITPPADVCYRCRGRVQHLWDVES